MKWMKDWWARQKWKEMLIVQLGISILLVNLGVLIVCFSFQYSGVERILLEKDESDNIERFKQSEYNIGSFVEQVEAVSRRLSKDDNMQKLSGSKSLSGKELVYYAKLILDSFTEMQTSYPYLQIISYYGENGIILKSGKGVGYGNFVLQDDEKSDWFYSSELFETIGEYRQKMKWYGGYSDKEFSTYVGTESTERYYVAAARNVVSGSGTLVLAIDMEYFLDIFYANNETTSENIYILDEKDRIVAARDSETLGVERRFSDGEEVYQGVYKYLDSGESGEMQVIVYSMPSMGWKLVSETPVAEVTKESQYLRNVLLFSCLISVVVSVALSMWWASKTLKPLKQLDKEMKNVGNGQLGNVLDNLPKNELGAVSRRFNEMSLELKELFLKNQRMEQEKREFEMQMLRAQINPHLIYNVLNGIKWRAIFSNERNIAESVSLLAEFLKPVFKNQNLMCTIEEELNYVKNYIAIMNLLRTGEFNLEITSPKEYGSYQMIRFLLQPVVENAIQHGYSEENSGKIRVFIWIKEEDAMIRVEDDGCGIAEEKLRDLQSQLERNAPKEGSGIGIINVNRRIKNQYGEKYGITICNGEEKGTVVTLKIRLDPPKNSSI